MPQFQKIFSFQSFRYLPQSLVPIDKGAAVAVALNFDARDEPEIELSGGLAKIMGFLEYVEGSVRDTMLPEGKGKSSSAAIKM